MIDQETPQSTDIHPTETPTPIPDEVHAEEDREYHAPDDDQEDDYDHDDHDDEVGKIYWLYVLSGDFALSMLI